MRTRARRSNGCVQTSPSGSTCLATAFTNSDGNDRIFGDPGNDWLVGGTGRDHDYGGFGNDLLNVDDKQETNLLRNDQPDTQPTYEDRAYGGAGRDVLIANTGGDRLIDWVGEFNSYRRALCAVRHGHGEPHAAAAARGIPLRALRERRGGPDKSERHRQGSDTQRRARGRAGRRPAEGRRLASADRRAGRSPGGQHSGR